MYTNPSNLIKTFIRMLETNREMIDYVVQVYEPDRMLSIFEGMRKTVPASAYPVLEIEPTNGSTQWATTRTQRPRYSFNCTLTVMNENEDYGVEYIATLATVLVEIMTDPQNLQLRVINEVTWDPTYGLVPTYILDSLAEDVTYNAAKEGTIRTAEFSLFAMIHEPFPDSHFWVYATNDPEPTELRPRELVIPPA